MDVIHGHQQRGQTYFLTPPFILGSRNNVDYTREQPVSYIPFGFRESLSELQIVN